MVIGRFFKNYYIFVLALLPLLSIAMVSIATGIFVLGGLIFYTNNKGQKLFTNNKLCLKALFWYSLPFSLLIFSLFWTEDFKNGLSMVEEGLLFLILPGTLFILKPIKSPDEIKKFIKIYIISSSVFSILMVTYVLYKILATEFSNDFSSYMGTVHLRSQFDKLPWLNEHPIYFTLLTGTALLLLFYNRYKQKWKNIMIVIILMVGIFLASSRGPILALFLVFIFVVYVNTKNKLRAAAIISFFILSGVLAVNLISPLKSRLNEITNTRDFYPKGIHYNSINLRMGIYKCSFQLMKEAPIFGYGAGDVQHKLDQCYEESFNTDAYQLTSYNSHNQYFYYWLSFGSIGFILIILSYIVYLKKALVFHDQEYIMFLLFFFITFVTENVLGRNTGIVLFTLFNSLFYYKNLIQHDRN